jgi:hypothetical protein
MSNKTGIRKGKDFIKNMEKLKKIYGGKIPKNLTIEEADATLKKVKPIKNKAGNMVLSPKADLDGDGTFSEYERKRGMAIQNAMAKNKKPEGAFIGKLFSQDKMKEMFSRIKGDPSIQDPEAYRQAYNKYATAYGNEPMKDDDPKVAKAGTGKFMVKGMGTTIVTGKHFFHFILTK